MSFELSLALRYLKTKRHGLFAVLTTLIAIGGVTLGVAALIVTLSVMNGFRADIQEKPLGIQPHVLLLGLEGDSGIQVESVERKIESLRDVTAAAPFVLGQTLLKTGRGAQGAVVRGILPEREFRVTGLEKTIVAGRWPALTEAASPPSIILGKELANALGASVGTRVLLFASDESRQPAGLGALPRVEEFTVGGIFNSGFYEYDANLAFISLDRARKAFGIAGVTGLGIRTRDLERSDEAAAAVAEAAGLKYWARSWQSMNRNLFEALKLEKIVMTIILTMIILVASFTIISNLILMSIEKTRDIGILRALGAGRASIRKIFVTAGLILGTTGIFLGTTLGVSIVKVLQRTQWIRLPKDVYYVDTLPVRISAGDIAWVVAAALLITLLSGLYPASQAAKVDPVEAIRYG